MMTPLMAAADDLSSLDVIEIDEKRAAQMQWMIQRLGHIESLGVRKAGIWAELLQRKWETKAPTLIQHGLPTHQCIHMKTRT